MRKIKYKKIIVQNFLSIGNDAIEIEFKEGLNLITGQNIDNPERKNAVGKSSLMSAYFYALFGETIGKIKNEYIVNNITKGKGRIELQFDVETTENTQSYKIIRQVKPTKVELWKGDEDITRDSIANTNKYICDLLGTNPIIHKSCDIMTLSDTTPFMLKNAAEKRKFIEDIFNIEIFGLMLKDLKKYISENKNDMSVSLARVEELKTSINTYQKQFDDIKKQIEERTQLLNTRKEEITNKIQNIKIKIEELPENQNIDELQNQYLKLEDAWKKIDGKLGNFQIKHIEISKDLDLLKKELMKMNSVDEVQCDKCFQNISHDHIKYINSKKEEIQNNISEYKINLTEINNQKEDWLDKKAKVQKNISKVHNEIQKQKDTTQKRINLNNILKEYEESFKNINDDFKNSIISTDSFEENIKNSETRKKEQEENLNTFKQKDSDYEICKFVLGEEGVKSYVIKKLLCMLNSTISTYITDLGMNVKCKFDEYFDEHISTEKGNEFSYSNLSGAEKRSVDIACVLSFSDMRRKISGISSNLEFYDEIFDSAFDERGLDLLINVLKSRINKNNMSVYAISHRKETIKHVDGEIVNLEKENGITRRVYQ
jgi:DNA repair exonuclease SbcCD ATPase subunit